MESTVFLFLLTLLNAWCAVSSGLLSLSEHGCSEEGSGTDSGRGGDETIDILCPTTTYSTHVPINQSISTPLPSSANSLVYPVLASAIEASSETKFRPSSEAHAVHSTGFYMPTSNSESLQTSVQTSLFALVTSSVVATVSGVMFTELLVFSQSRPRFSSKVITPTAVITIQPTSSSSPILTQTTLVQAGFNSKPTTTLSTTEFSLSPISRSSTTRIQLSTSSASLVNSTATIISSIYHTKPELVTEATSSPVIRATEIVSGHVVLSSQLSAFTGINTLASQSRANTMNMNVVLPTSTLTLAAGLTPTTLSLNATQLFSTVTYQQSSMYTSIESVSSSSLLLPTLNPPSSVLSPYFRVYITNIETLQPPQKTTRPRLLPRSHPSPPHTLMASSEDIVTQSEATPTDPVVGMTTYYLISTGSGPAVSLEVGVESSATSLFIAVGSSVGGFAVIAVVFAGLIAMVIVVHKRRRHFRGGTLRRTSMTRDRSAELYHHMSEIDGRLTTQLSRSSMLSGTTVTPTLTGDTERKMFDNTMITAYDSSTFRRSKHVSVPKSENNNQEGHMRGSPVTEGLTENHTRSTLVTTVCSQSAEEDCEINQKRGTVLKLQPPTVGEKWSVTNEKGRSAENSPRDNDEREREDESSTTSINEDLATEAQEKEIALESYGGDEYPTIEKQHVGAPTENNVVEEESQVLSEAVEALQSSRCDQSQANGGELEEGPQSTTM